MSLFREERWADTVTIYHRVVSKDERGRTVTDWSRNVAEGVFYGLSKRQIVSGSVLTEHDKHICRIPAEAGIEALEKGDVICFGEVSVEIPQNGSPEKYLTDTDHFTAGITADNRQLKLTAHWYASEA